MGNLVLPEPHDIAHEDDLGYLGLPGPSMIVCDQTAVLDEMLCLFHVNLACSVKRPRKRDSQALSADVKSVSRIHHRSGREWWPDKKPRCEDL